MIASALIIFILDRITKYIVIQEIKLWQSVPIIEDIFSITRVHNSGAAFGILTNQRIFFVVVGILMIILLIWLWTKIDLTTWWHKLGYGFLIGGALGNLWDRIRWGYVVDFIDIHFWPVFNIADMAIVIAVVLYLLYMVSDTSEVNLFGK